jgi:ABC-type multidrug transport system ATPase subunit
MEIVFNNDTLHIKNNKIYALISNDSYNKEKLFLNLSKKNIYPKNIKLSYIKKDNTLINKNINIIKYIYKKVKIKDINIIVDILCYLRFNKEILTKQLNELNNYYLKLIEIAITIINNNNVIILDEPFYKINGYEENNLIQILTSLKRNYNITFIILTKNTNIIYKFIDYFFIINHGNIELEGKRENLSKITKNMNVNKPEICEFIEIIRKKHDKDFRFFSDVRDLVKEIYRYIR